VVLEAQPVEGLDDDISALTYDPDRKSLFTVTNARRADRAVAGRASCAACR
jgi:uncharacterized protein YjiK